MTDDLSILSRFCPLARSLSYPNPCAHEQSRHWWPYGKPPIHLATEDQHAVFGGIAQASKYVAAADLPLYRRSL